MDVDASESKRNSQVDMESYAQIDKTGSHAGMSEASEAGRQASTWQHAAGSNQNGEHIQTSSAVDAERNSTASDAPGQGSAAASPAQRALDAASSSMAERDLDVGEVGRNSNIGNGSAEALAYRSPGGAPSASTSPSRSGPTILMASRKQNSACDACRSRKVRCNRDPGEAKCNHCKAKNIECTTLYVQWATSSSKRPVKRARTSLLAVSDDEKKEVSKPPEIADAVANARDRLMNALFQRDTEYAPVDNHVYYYNILPCNTPISANGYRTRNVMPSAYLPGPKPAAITNAELHLLDRQRREDFVNDLVETYFSVVHARLPLLNPQTFRKRYYERSKELGGPPSDITLAIVMAWGAKFSENPLIAQDRAESASELQKAFSQAQCALLKGESDKADQITGIKGGIEQPILTVPEELRTQGRNRIADHLTWRAQDIMDRLRVARVATLENAQACLLMESMLQHPSVYFNGNPNISGTPVAAPHRSLLEYTNGHWYVIAIKHMLDLGIHCKEKVMTIKDPALRGETLFVWWLACIADSASALYFQRRCLISSEDYNSDPPVADADNKKVAPHPLDSIDSYLAFFGSMHDAVNFQRMMSSMHFAPRSHIEGVPFAKIAEIAELLKKWRADHLEKVGVPLPHWPPHWDYIAAVSACTSDINYHANWICLWRLVDEMGILGTDRSDATSPIHQERLKRRSASEREPAPREDAPDPERVQAVLATIQEEALNSALRIAGLTEILRSNQYLRLDPANSLQSLEMAAHMLIRFQRSEVDIIVAGFRQYGLSYEDCFDKADLMEDMAAAYNARARTDPHFVPGSALGLAMDRDASAEQNGIPELAIAAAALSNAAASADSSAHYAFEPQQAQQPQNVDEGQDAKDAGDTFESIFHTPADANGATGAIQDDSAQRPEGIATQPDAAHAIHTDPVAGATSI